MRWGRVLVLLRDRRPSIARLCAGTIAPGVAARGLQTFIVQVPPLWRRKLVENGHAEFIAGYGDRFAELRNWQLYKPEVGLLWEEADALIGDGII